MLCGYSYEKKENKMSEQNEQNELNEKKGFIAKIYNDNIKWHDIGIITVVIAYIILIASSIAGAIICLPLNGPVQSDETGFWYIFYAYFSNIGAWVVIPLYCFIVKKNRYINSAFGRKRAGNTVKMLLIGFLAGFATNTACIIGAFLHGDIHLYFDSFAPIKLLILFIAVFVQSSAEEILCRGFMYERFRKAYRGPWVAIILNAVIFSCLHLGNPGVTPLALANIVVAGLFFSLMVYYTDSIWCAFACHTAWNFNQNIIFGLPNSGMVSPYSLMRLDASTASDSFAYNVGFGVEGTWLATLILAACCIVMIVVFEKKKKNA